MYDGCITISGDDFLIEKNTVSRCTVKNCEQDGFDITGDQNSLDGCKATDCSAEGLDNDGTATTATNCTFKASRIDYAGNRNMADDTGTKYDTGGPDVAPEID